MATEEGSSWQETKTLPERIEHMFYTKLHSDVTFMVGADLEDEEEQEVLAHKFILLSASPVFEAMFSGSFKEASAEKIKIPDLFPDIFEEMLRFIYTDEVDVDQNSIETTLTSYAGHIRYWPLY